MATAHAITLTALPQALLYKVIWLAGLIDGEGCLYVGKGPRGTIKPSLSIGTVSSPMIAQVTAIYTTLGLRHSQELPRMLRLSKRPAYRIAVSQRASLATLLAHLLPYLVVKKPEAEVLLAYLRAYPLEYAPHARATPAIREALRVRMKELKRAA